jgi:hypothetical protein
MLVSGKGTAGLVVMLLFVAVVLYYVPATRLFLLFSIPVGLGTALLLRYWYRRRPIEDTTEKKRPLGL